MQRVKPAATVAVAILLAAAILIYSIHRPDPKVTLIGVVRTTEVRVEPEVNGQLVSIAVQKGGKVHVGDVLAKLSATEE